MDPKPKLSSSASIEDFMSQEMLAREDERSPPRVDRVQDFLKKSRELLESVGKDAVIEIPRRVVAPIEVKEEDFEEPWRWGEAPSVGSEPTPVIRRGAASEVKVEMTPVFRKEEVVLGKSRSSQRALSSSTGEVTPVVQKEGVGRVFQREASSSVMEEVSTALLKESFEPAKSRSNRGFRQSSSSSAKAEITPVFRRMAPRQQEPERMRFGRAADPVFESDDEQLVTYSALRKREKANPMKLSDLESSGSSGENGSAAEIKANVSSSPRVSRPAGRPHPMELLTQRRVLPPERPRLRIELVQELAFGVPGRVEREEEEEEVMPDFVERPVSGIAELVHRVSNRNVRAPPSEEEEQEEEQDATEKPCFGESLVSTIEDDLKRWSAGQRRSDRMKADKDEPPSFRRFVRGRSVAVKNARDERSPPIRFQENIDPDDLDFNLSHLYEEEED
jgi:hypothetical protein